MTTQTQNAIVVQDLPVLQGTASIRDVVLGLLTDADLSYRLPGDNPTFGEVCREMGDVQRSYIDSFKTLKQSWDYRHADTNVQTSLAALKAWYKSLDDEMAAVLTAFSEADVASKTIERGSFSPDLRLQVQIYIQALLIFYGKAACYLRALQKPLPEMFVQWVG
jgi:hypothetical protein